MIRALHARDVLMALSRAAEAGPVFDAIHRCIYQLDEIEKQERVESLRSSLITELQISVRLHNALRDREIETVRQLEAMTAAKLMESPQYPSLTTSLPFGKKMLRETREVLASLGMKLKGDP